MSNEKSKTPGPKPAAPASPATAPAAPAPLVKTPPLFRRVDWITGFIAFAAVWIGYYLTLAPELTLEDSGELAVGSLYAGIPHPPGYPVWTIYTWLWTVLLPIKNIAWRVALGEATSGAIAAGLLGFLVSRGSSLLMEGIEELKSMAGRWESAICMISGAISGMLLGFNGFMWSQSVIVEVYSFSVASLMLVLLCLLRWIYAPHQRRFLYYALFFHGLCFTNHQTLIVAAIGIEIAIAAADFKLGRNLFLGNSILYLGGLILVQQKALTALEANHAVYVIFNVIGVLSIAAYLWFVYLTKQSFTELCRDAMWAGAWLLLASAPTLGIVGVLLAFVAIGGFANFAWKTRQADLGWLVVLVCGFCWIAGASFYFYMPLAGMTNPPMQWGYPRTVDGFIHAFTRGQYEKTNPTDILGDPLRFLIQLKMLGIGIVEEFNWVYVILALVPFLFFFKLHKRERAWLIGITAIYLCLAVLLLILLNPPPDRAAQELVRVFFTASHTMIALLIGYGLTLIAAYMATHHAQFRRWGVWAGAFAAALSLYTVAESADVFVKSEGAITPIKHLFAALAAGVGFGTLVAVLAAYFIETKYYEDRTTSTKLGLAGVAFGFLVVQAGLWLAAGQVGTVGGLGQLLSTVANAFARDQYGLPIFGALLLLFMSLAFIVSLVVYRNRAPLAITLGLFALIPLHPIMTHWSDNEQRGHWFGYWFGHDMFTPPFQSKDGKPLYPEMDKDAILYGGTDPGRFRPTYMIFADSFVPGKELPSFDQKFDRRDVYIITQNALADGTYLNYIRAHYNRSQQIDPPFFMGLLDFVQTLCLPQPEREAKAKGEYYNLNAPAKVVGSFTFLAEPLDRFFTDLGDRIEKRRRTFTSWFKVDHFTDVNALVSKLAPAPGQDPVSKFIYENLAPETQKLLTSKADPKSLKPALAADLNRLIDREEQAWSKLEKSQSEKTDLDQELAGGAPTARQQRRQQELTKEIEELSKVVPLYTPERFKDVQLSEYLQDFVKQDPRSHTRVRLNRLLLEAVYPAAIAKSKGGVYPDREMYIASPKDSQKCFEEYLQDAQRRLQLNQLKPGEDVRVIDNRVQVSGQVAVMSINGLLTKVMFDANPKNEFYVEESFPLDWMYPHLTPYGIIMKINRKPLPELTEDILQRDHEFWSKFSERLIGNWITYDTKIQDIADFVEKTYLRRDFRGFKGDRKFVRDDQAQKAFSKLRSSIGGVYNWRIAQARPGSPEQARMIREAEFAFRQSFAFCPYSPEAVFRYVQLLVTMQRLDEALILAKTCLKLDPHNGSVIGLIANLNSMKKSMAGPPEAGSANQNLAALEQALQQNPANFQAAFNLAGSYFQMQNPARAQELLDGVMNHPRADAAAMRALIQAWTSVNNTGRLQLVADKLVALARANPNDADASIVLAEAYRALQKKDQADQAIDAVLNNPAAGSRALHQVLPIYAAATNTAKIEAITNRLGVILQKDPEDIEASLALAEAYRDLKRNDLAIKTLDVVLTSPRADMGAILQAAQQYASLGNYSKLEAALEKLVKVAPEAPEAWYDLAALRASVGKSTEALQALRQALALSSKRLKTTPTARNLHAEAEKDTRFAFIKQTPEFRQLLSNK